MFEDVVSTNFNHDKETERELSDYRQRCDIRDYTQGFTMDSEDLMESIHTNTLFW